MILQQFQQALKIGDITEFLAKGLIGEGMEIQTAKGPQKLVYADYTASGRALQQVEDFVSEKVLPYYANSHTEASFCGAYMTGLREEARGVVADLTNAGEGCTVIFSGSGATSAINRLVALSGIAEFVGRPKPPVVFVGPYEHHSNILPWRESGALVIEIDEAAAGGPDLDDLLAQLTKFADHPLLIGAFSAASNVTGIVTDTDAVTAILKNNNALAFWDYAGGAPYLSIDMNPGAGLEKDAVFLSPHKFPGGPGASGLLILRDSMVRVQKPTWPGGGSVSYVSPWAHDYLDSLIEREEAGTPNIIGDIRAALVMLIQDAVGTKAILQRDAVLSARAEQVWRKNPRIQLLGDGIANRLPIFSFLVRDAKGGFIHHQLFTRMLSDHTGVQVRGGCVCAGPYGHRLLQVDRAQSEEIRAKVLAGQEVAKPGWVRLNFNYLMSDETADFIIEAVDRLARQAPELAREYANAAAHALQFDEGAVE